MINRSNCIGLIAAMALAAGVLLGTGCTQKSNPVNSTTAGTLDTANRVGIWRDSAIVNPDNYNWFFQLNLNDTITKTMSFEFDGRNRKQLPRIDLQPCEQYRTLLDFYTSG